MRLSEILGQDRAVRILQNALRRGQVGHAYLFIGPEGVGKRLTAEAFARALNCTGSGKNLTEACGVCPSCRKMDSGNHTDFKVIEPEGLYTKIDQTRALKHDLQYAPLQHRWKIYLFSEAETMNAEAANNLLKALEEPPAHTVFLLLSANPAAVLPTIRSRCQPIRFGFLPLPLVRQTLAEQFGLNEEETRFLASYSSGRLGQAMALARIPDVFARREEVLRLLESLSSLPAGAALRLSEDLRSLAREAKDKESEEGDKGEDKEKFSRRATSELLDIMAAWFRDLLILKAQANTDGLLTNSDYAPALRQSAGCFTEESLHEAIETIFATRRHIERNANLSLALDIMMIKLLRCRSAAAG
ncbi:MAG: DNA polymerase III subunit delta' [Armatimonadetes bacterium]|nr:DNA polymerase III subunit delta' [Armatimonadota bacterium]